MFAERTKVLRGPARLTPAAALAHRSQFPLTHSLGSSHAFRNVPRAPVGALLPAKLFSATSLRQFTFFGGAFPCPPDFKLYHPPLTPYFPFLIYLLLFHSTYQHREETLCIFLICLAYGCPCNVNSPRTGILSVLFTAISPEPSTVPGT